jgi:hypothetical protein
MNLIILIYILTINHMVNVDIVEEYIGHQLIAEP